MAPAACVFSPAMAAGCELRGLAAARGAAPLIRSASAIYMTEVEESRTLQTTGWAWTFFSFSRKVVEKVIKH